MMNQMLNPLMNPVMAGNPSAMGFMNSLSMPQGGVMFPGMGSMDMSAFNPMMMPYATMPMFSGSAASFHLPGPKNEMKLFVGGLQFQTTGMIS